MNPALALLVSRAYDGGLAPEHRADLEKSGLTHATICEALIRSVPPSMIPRLLGFDAPGVVSALLFPFRAPAGGFMDHVRVKVFPPMRDAEGHSVKYLQPRGSRPRLYFAAATMRAAFESDAPLFIIEGEKKALSIAQLGEPAVGISGIEGWHEGGRDALLPDFDCLRLADRLVKLWPDADWRSNLHVHRAVHRLAHALIERDARVEVIVPPEVPA